MRRSVLQVEIDCSGHPVFVALSHEGCDEAEAGRGGGEGRCDTRAALDLKIDAFEGIPLWQLDEMFAGLHMPAAQMQLARGRNEIREGAARDWRKAVAINETGGHELLVCIQHKCRSSKNPISKQTAANQSRAHY